MGSLILFLGGAKSGKTRLALAAAENFPSPHFYLATAQAFDAEMETRIKNHQTERNDNWRTLEAPLEPDRVLEEANGQVVLVDCLTLWLNNLLAENENSAYVMSRVNDLAKAVKKYSGPVIIVSNDVGGGVVPMNALARKFRDLSGMAHQLLAAQAEKVFLVTAGLPLALK